MMKPVLACSARIQVTVEVDVGSWGSDCQLDQIYRQAAREALAKVSRLIGSQGRVSNPKVLAVMVPESR